MSLSSSFKKMADDLKMLEGDVKIAEAKSEKKVDIKKIPSSKALMPMTRLFKSKEDIESAKKNPEVFNLIAKVGDIFK